MKNTLILILIPHSPIKVPQTNLFVYYLWLTFQEISALPMQNNQIMISGLSVKLLKTSLTKSLLESLISEKQILSVE